MPPTKSLVPESLEKLCLKTYITLLQDETEIIFHLRAYSSKSILFKTLSPDQLTKRLEQQFTFGIPGILQDIVRQAIVENLILNFHTLVQASIQTTRSCRSYQVLSQRLSADRSRPASLAPETEALPSTSTSRTPPTSWSPPKFSSSNLRFLPLFQQLLIILNYDVKVLDFSKNRFLIETEDTNEICRTLWKIIGEKCDGLEKLILTKDLTYSSTLDGVIVNGSRLTHITLKRNVPNNIFLNLIGQHCPLLQELDVAGAEIINDFGIVCLLFSDPEEIFLKCWNKEKTVGQIRRTLRVFPQPYYDRQIPDQQEPVPRTNKTGNAGNYLYLRKSFHDALRSNTGESGDWDLLPIAKSIRKLRLENTKVKGDGASIVLESCPNIYSMGYLVFAAAGLKQVFGYEEKTETKMTEIFYRGPSDQKLHTISNCCPDLKTLFLGSNNPRALSTKIFQNWKSLSYLTLENIVVESVLSCLDVVGSQIEGLKLQCAGLSLQDIAILCPKLKSLIIQKESPNPLIKSSRPIRSDMFGCLQHLEVSSPHFSKQCMEFLLSHASKICTIKVFNIPKLMRQDLDAWFSNKALPFLRCLIIFKGPSMTMESTLWMLKELPSLRYIGINDLNSTDAPKSQEFKKLQTEIKKMNWDIDLVDFGEGVDSEERDFAKLQNLHWFYLTPNENNTLCSYF